MAGPAVIEWEGSVAYGAAVLLAGLLLALGVGLIWRDASTFAEVYRGQFIPVLVGPVVAVAAGAAIVHGVRQGIEAMRDS